MNRLHMRGPCHISLFSNVIRYSIKYKFKLIIIIHGTRYTTITKICKNILENVQVQINFSYHLGYVLNIAENTPNEM